MNPIGALKALAGGLWAGSRLARVVNLTLLALFVGLAYTAYDAAGQDTPAAQPVETAMVKRETVLSTVAADGNVEARKEIPLAFAAGGRVTDVAVKEGEPVRRGQILARVDDDSARAAVRSSERSLRSAEAKLADTRAGKTVAELERNARSADSARLAVAQAEQDVVNARAQNGAQVKSLRGAVKRARVSGERAQLKAARLRLAQERTVVRQERAGYLELSETLERLRSERVELLDRQRGQENVGSEADDRRSRLETDLSTARSEQSDAESDSDQARRDQTDTCAEDSSSRACDQAREDLTEAEQDRRDADREVQDSEREVDDAERDDLESTQQVNDLDFQITTLDTRIATTETDESRERGDFDSAESNVRSYLSDVESDESTLREARRTRGTAADSLREGIVEVEKSIDEARSSVTSSEASLASSLASNRVDEQGADAADIASDVSSVASAEQSLEDARKSLEDTVLRAPAEGTASAVDIEEGEIAGSSSSGSSSSSTSTSDTSTDSSTTSTDSSSSGSASSGTVVTLTQMKGLEFKADYAETDASKLRVGNEASLSVDALPGQRVPARVASILPVSTVVDNVVTYQVTFTIDAYPPELRPGMSASSDVTVERLENVVAVPKSAIRNSKGTRPTATVVDSAGQQQPRLVVVGVDGDASTEIIGGLGEGERVAVGGARQ